MTRTARWWRPYGDAGPTLKELAQQAWSSTDGGYDLLAPRFEHTPFCTPDDVVARALAVLAGTSPARGLDLCCGTGAGLAQLRAHCRNVVGLDRSAGMLAQAQLRVPDAALVRGDALALPFVGSFDVVCCFGAFGHILVEDERLLVARVHAALKPGGRFLFVTATLPPLFSLSRWLAHGFNAAMRVRNAVKQPAFVMYYLTFLLPRATQLLVDAGFEVRTHPLGEREGYVVVDARRA